MNPWPKRILYTLIGLILIAGIVGAVKAETVLSCADAWGSSSSCGGCSGMTWETAAPNLKVKTNASDFWKLFSSLAQTDLVSISNQPAGTTASCPQIAGTATVASLLGAPPPPPPTTTPQNGTLVLNWTAPTTNPQGQPVTVTGYHVRWTGAATGEYITGNVLTYTISGPPGNYSVTVAAIDATGESAPSNPATGTIAAPNPDPPPPPPPPPDPTPAVVTIGFAPGVLQIPVYGVTSAGARSSTVVGVIDVGVQCIGAQLTTYRSQGYRLVPRAAVKWHATTPTDQAMAACR